MRSSTFGTSLAAPASRRRGFFVHGRCSRGIASSTRSGDNPRSDGSGVDSDDDPRICAKNPAHAAVTVYGGPTYDRPQLAPGSSPPRQDTLRKSRAMQSPLGGADRHAGSLNPVDCRAFASLRLRDTGARAVASRCWLEQCERRFRHGIDRWVCYAVQRALRRSTTQWFGVRTARQLPN